MLQYDFDLECTDHNCPYQYSTGRIEILEKSNIEIEEHPDETKVRHIFTEHTKNGIRLEDETDWYPSKLAYSLLKQDGASLKLDLALFSEFLQASTKVYKIKGQ